MNGRNSQVARIYRILNLLEGSPQGLSANEIRQRLSERGLNVSKRTIYRDLEALSDSGFPLFPTEEQNDMNATRWILERRTKINQYLALSSQELFALYLARGMFSRFQTTALQHDFKAVFQKIEDKLSSTHQNHFAELSSEIRFDSSLNWELNLDTDVLDTVRAGCAERQVLSLDYESVNSATFKRRRLGPHYIYFAKGSVYLIAEDLATHETKIFALPRMKNVVMEEQTYEAQAVDPEKFFQDSFGVFRGHKAVDVKIEFSKTMAAYVRERKWHSSQKIDTTSSGSIQLSMNVSVTPELVQWLLGFGPDAKVLHPRELRTRVGASIARMAELYVSQ